MQETRADPVHERETLRLAGQAELDGRRSRVERNRLGQFATPNRLAADIASYCVELLDPAERIRFLEPAVGSGSFYSALLRVAGRDRVDTALGFEIDDRFAGLARELWGDVGLEVVAGDFTELYHKATGANLVLTNPPYVRHHHLGQATKSRLRHEAATAAGLSVSGLAGLYVYFMALAHPTMAEGAVAAWLVPSEFMGVNYGSAVRDYLTGRVELVRIHRFDPDDVQFGDALVSSAVIVFRNRPPSNNGTALLTFGGSLLNPARVEPVRVPDLRGYRKWTAHSGAAPPTSRAETVTIGDLFDIRRGLVTGANSFFIMNRTRALELRIPERFLKPVLPSPRHLAAKTIPGDGDGYPLVDPQLVLLDSDLPRQTIRDRYPRLDEYLEAGAALGIDRRYLPSRRSPWYSQEKRLPAPFLSTYMGRGSGGRKPFRFLWNQSQAVATNVYLLLYPKQPLARMVRCPDKARLVHRALDALDADELRAGGRVYGGGLYKMEPRELQRMRADSIVEALPDLAEPADRLPL